jgi:hypothetical protein
MTWLAESHIGEKRDNIAALKSNGELFALGRPRNYQEDTQWE